MPAPAANKENSAKHSTTTIPGAPDQAPISARVMVATQKHTISVGRRPALSMTSMPIIAPSAARPLAAMVLIRSSEMCKVANTSGAKVKMAK
jgi:hypothetical protein